MAQQYESLSPNGHKNLVTAIFEKLKGLLDKKVDKVTGKGLSTNDYTTTEKTKLSGIAIGAEVNQNAFSNVKVGTTTVSADSKTDTLELSGGANITITPDATNDKVTITHSNSGVTAGTYKSVTVNATGHVTSGTNPSTLSGYGITDAKIANGTITLGSNTITPLTSHQAVTDNNPTLAWGTKSKVATIGDTEINVTMPSNPNTDTKVTSVGNHYTPAENTASQLDADASSTTAATWNSTSLVTGVTIKRDAKGHVVGLAVDSIKMPANPNSNTTYTLSADTTNNKITLTPSSGTAQSITVPYATSAGSATKATQDGSGNVITSTYVKKTGDTMTGDLILYKEGTTTNNHPSSLIFSNKDTTTGQTYSNAYIKVYQDHGSTTYGTNMVIHTGGGLFLGSGESPASHYSTKGASYSGEDTFLTADGTAHLQANGNTIANRVGVQITTGHALVPEKADVATNNIGSIGTSSYKWANGYFTNINGVAVGNNPKFTDTTYSAGTGLSLSGTSFSVNNSTITPYEARLQWGGKDFSADYGCIDAAMVNELGANRLMFTPGSAVTIEYSRDNGSTWTDYGASNTDKTALFSSGANFYIGKADSSNKATANGGKYQLRVTIDTGAASIYTVLNKLVIYVSTNGSAGCKVKIQKALQSTPTTFVDHKDWTSISGWSGYNVLNIASLTTYGNTAGSQYGRVRFIFADGTGGNTSYTGLHVDKIMGFGGVGWSTPSTMAKTGHLYSFDASQNATFPAQVTATKFVGALQGNVTGNCSGSSGSCTGNSATATTASKLSANAGSATNPVYFTGGVPTACTYSLNKTVPSDAVFTDHTYNFSGTTFYSGNRNTAEHNCNNAIKNGVYYYTSNGATTSIGASTNDGALYVQAYSDNWVGQICQDYLNGNLFTRGKNNGTWSDWRKVMYSNDTYSGTLTKSQVTTALGYTPPTANTDVNVKVNNTNPASGTWYYPTWYTATSGIGNVNANDGLRYYCLQGTASAAGRSILSLGNNTSTGTAGNKRGELFLYSEKSGRAEIVYDASSTATVVHTFPATAGTILNTGTTSFTQSLSSGTKIGTIKINGTSTDLYCQTNTNTHRPIQVNGTEILGNNTTALNLKAGSNVSVTNSSGTVTIAATDTNNAVTQTATSTNANYEVLFSATADNTTRTEGARKYSNLTFNPSTGTLTTNFFVGGNNGGSWHVGRNNATVKKTTADNTSIFYPIWSVKTYTGDWSAGTLGSGGEALYFVNTLDTNYFNNVNKGRKYRFYGSSNADDNTTYDIVHKTSFTSGQVVVADGTSGLVKTSGYTIAKSVPSDAVFTDSSGNNRVLRAGDSMTGDLSTTGSLSADMSVIAGVQVGAPIVIGNSSLYAGSFCKITSAGTAGTNGSAYIRAINDETGTTHTLIKIGNGSISCENNAGTPVSLIASGLELSHATPLIDFHHNSSTQDFTSRIITTNLAELTFYGKNSGGTTVYGTCRGAAFTVVSSKYMKENIKDIEDDEAMKLLQLRPVSFDYKYTGETNKRGLIAEEVMEVMPEMVYVPEEYSEPMDDSIPDNVPSIDYSKFVPYLIKMVQIQQKEIDELKEIMKG